MATKGSQASKSGDQDLYDDQGVPSNRQGFWIDLVRINTSQQRQTFSCQYFVFNHAMA